jgi:hypothetical protein
MEEDIRINSAVLHILDINISTPIISGGLLEIDEDIEIFLTKHISKIISDINLQKAYFTEDSFVQSVCKDFSEENIDLIEASGQIAKHLFGIMLKNVDIPSCDLIVCNFFHNEMKMMAVLKLNYKMGYSHYVNQSEEGVRNVIVVQRTLLPVEGQKVEEFALVNLEDMSLTLIQKEYEINGTKEAYWSTLFLKCRSELSNSKKLRIIEKAAKDVTKRHFEEDFTMVAQTRKALAETLEEGNPVEIEEIAKEIFKDDEELKKEYISEVKKAGLREEVFEVPQNVVGKKLLNHKIKTDNGIEINFPAQYYDDINKIEFVNNVDGSISIIIKNVGIKF